MLAPGGQCYNYSGCGNTFNCNHPVVRQFIVDCLRYWVQEMHVDGFRCGAASWALRGRVGCNQPPLLAHSCWVLNRRQCPPLGTHLPLGTHPLPPFPPPPPPQV